MKEVWQLAAFFLSLLFLGIALYAVMEKNWWLLGFGAAGLFSIGFLRSLDGVRGAGRGDDR